MLELSVEEALRRSPATLAELVDEDGATLLRMRVSSLDWGATVLAGLGCAFSIRSPDELRASVRALGERLASPPRRRGRARRAEAAGDSRAAEAPRVRQA